MGLLRGPLLLLLLLLGPPAAQGDCNIPPEVPNAQPTLGDLLSFQEGTTVTYKCNEGFVKVPGRADSVVCLNNTWSEVAEFCSRSCDVPTRLLFASLKKSFTKQNYFPAGSIVEYECRPGFQRNRFLSGKLTCLQNFTWSKPDEFCKKKSCPNPGDLRHGHVSIPTDLLYGSSISFSCNEGYRLVGETSSYCSLVDEGVGWSDPFPECQEIFCPEPPEISNGFILDPRDTYVYQQTIKYRCNESFTLIGENSIYCTVRGDQGEWSGLPPECKGSQISKVTPPVQKSTTVIVSATKPTSTPQKPTTANVPGSEATSTQKPSAANVSAKQSSATPRTTSTPNGKGTLSSGAAIIAIGKFGSSAVKKNCHHCGMYNPYSWKRILSFYCLRNTIKMKCLRVSRRRQVNAVYRRVWWTPIGTRYVAKYSRPCSCSRVILGQLQIIWPVSQVSLNAYCLNASSF
ncbi:complement decay-accelerating factor isoform X5 [Leptonychotes weddellii]|uniref:Complement decay-accelerating factor isoform X5 n=1 Tax=Leptonychotes weddellii TaxID=9713 RepID=A0A7F8QHQ6_LEPWE|nr:complement decay-accelerating factor isoform X5 [Leptonychotes weddellii]